jgi:hypothetical protein
VTDVPSPLLHHPAHAVGLLVVAAALAGGLGGGAGCGLMVTNDQKPYEELSTEEKSAVDTILKELTAFDKQVKTRTTFNIDEVIDRSRINVSFHSMILATNLGDGTIHISTWEDLSPEQQTLVGQWFKTTAAPSTTKAYYQKFFYQFLAVVQGVKQFMFHVLTPTWVYEHRTLYSIERDSIRTTLSHYIAEGRKSEMWTFVSALCTPVIAQYDATYTSVFTKAYLADHFTELAAPENPTGYMYFLCRWIVDGEADAESDLTTELVWLRDLPLP